MSELREIQQSVNAIDIVGTLKEMNFGIVTQKNRLFYGSEGLYKEVECDTFAKSDFRSPTFLIDVNGHDIVVDYYGMQFGVSEAELDDSGNIKRDANGNIEPSTAFKTLRTISAFKPLSECKEGEEATRVQIGGYLRQNEYAKDDKFNSFPVIFANKISHTSVPAEDKCDCILSGVIRSLNPEVRTENEEEVETGRLKIEFFYFDKKKNTYPINFVVEDDLADAVADLYQPGNSCKIFYEVLVRRVGASKPVADEGGVGRRKANISTGFTVTEYSLFDCTAPFDEENNLFVGMEEMKEVMEARKLTIETKIAEAKAKAKTKSSGETKTTASPKGASAGVGRREFKGTEGAGSPF